MQLWFPSSAEGEQFVLVSLPQEDCNPPYTIIVDSVVMIRLHLVDNQLECLCYNYNVRVAKGTRSGIPLTASDGY